MEEHPAFNADEVICLLSNGSPRNMIRICERILAVQAERKPDSTIIDFDSFDKGLLEFCETSVTENYGVVISREIQRVGRELFTTNYLANDIFKITANGARNNNGITYRRIVNANDQNSSPYPRHALPEGFIPRMRASKLAGRRFHPLSL